MTAAGEVIGTFAIYHRKAYRPHEQDERLLAEAGNLAAVAIQATRNRSALKESEKRFRSTFEQAAVGIAHVAPDGQFLRINRKFCDIVGYTCEEMLAGTFQQITHPDDISADLAYVNRVLAGEIPTYALEKRYLCKDGTLVWVNLTVALVRKDDGSPDYFISVIEDITTRKQAEENLRASENQLRLFVEHSPAAIAMFDTDMRYLVASRRWLEDYNLRDRQLTGRSHYDIFPEISQRWKDIHRRCLAGAIERCEEDPFVRADGKTDWVHWEIRPWHRTNEEIGGIIIFSEVITARKQAEQTIAENAERLEHLSRRLLAAQETERRHVARELHDEIGQLLTVVKIDLQSVVQQPGMSGMAPALRDSMASIDRVVERVRDMSLDLRPSMLDDLGLLPTLRWYLQRQTKSPGNRLRIEPRLPAAMPRLPGDIETACFRVAQEAITNAVRHAQASYLALTLTLSSDTLELSVSDDGQGFDRVAARRRMLTGAGAGLLGMTERVELIGGQLSIDSRPGKGTVITARFPVTNDKDSAA